MFGHFSTLFKEGLFYSVSTLAQAMKTIENIEKNWCCWYGMNAVVLFFVSVSLSKNFELTFYYHFSIR